MNLMKLSAPLIALSLLSGCVKWVYEYRDESTFSFLGQDYTVARKWAKPKGNVDEDDWDFANYVVWIDGGWVDCGVTLDTCANTIERVLNAPEDQDGNSGGGSDSGDSDSGGGDSDSGGGDTDGPV